MTVKEWLQRAWFIDQEIKELKAERDRLYDKATGIERVFSDEKQILSSENVSEKRINEYLEYAELVNDRCRELDGIKCEILSVINMVDNAKFRLLLIARYINFGSWEYVAESLGYSDKWVRTKLHSDALNAVKKILKDELDSSLR